MQYSAANASHPLYIANIRMPTEKAHGLQIVKMCSAFARLGMEVELVAPFRFNHIAVDPFSYYGVPRTFTIRRLFSIDLVRWGFLGFLIQSLSFYICALGYTLWRRMRRPGSACVIYSREELFLGIASFFIRGFFWEAHEAKNSFLARRAARNAAGIVAISRGLKEYYVGQNVAAEKIFVAPDGVDLKEFSLDISKEEARKKLDIPVETPTVVYTGHLYGWKGVDTLIGAAKKLPGVNVYLVGGIERDISAYRRKGLPPHIHIVGQRPHSEIPLWLCAADVLVLPNSAKEAISRLYTSPIKLFEYMASGRPIVASDLPSIREILSDETAVFVASDNADALRDGIQKLLREKEFAATIAMNACREAGQYTWHKRAERIIAFLSSHGRP